MSGHADARPLGCPVARWCRRPPLPFCQLASAAPRPADGGCCGKGSSRPPLLSDASRPGEVPCTGLSGRRCPPPDAAEVTGRRLDAARRGPGSPSGRSQRGCRSRLRIMRCAVSSRGFLQHSCVVCRYVGLRCTHGSFLHYVNESLCTYMRAYSAYMHASYLVPCTHARVLPVTVVAA